MKLVLPDFANQLLPSRQQIAKANPALRLGALALLALLGSRQPAIAQAGKNGALTVSTTGTILNEYTALTANAVVGATSITVASSSLNANGRFTAPLAAGDLLLLMQPQGATINSADANTYGTVAALNNAGRYQLVEVAAVPTAITITLSCRVLSAFTTAGRTQVVRVPRYTKLDVAPGTTVTAAPWNGSTGGVLVVETVGNVTLGSGATFDVSALGFRGGAVEQSSDGAPNTDLGYRSASAGYGAEKGESIAGSGTDYDALGGRYGRGAAANGGGGGNAHNAAGGGGANAAASGATYTGLGNPDRGAGNAYDAAWNLEAAGFATATSSGGGRGGYSFSSNNQNALTLATGQAAWGGDLRQNKGGLGGHPVATTGRAFFGGGGGAGDSNNSTGTPGGAGGGFLYVVSGGGVSGGTLLANGGSVSTASGNDGAGGGGGGGSIVVNATGLLSSGLTARGGTGGSQVLNSNEAEGAGGGGGGGYATYTTGSPGIDVSGGANGTSSSLAVTEFAPNGGTGGGAGSATGAACTPTLCPTAVADVATSVSFGSNPQTANQTATVNVSFVNNGPDAAADVVRLVQLPAGLGGGVTVSTSVGTGTYDNGTGQVTFTPTPLASLANGGAANATITFTPTASGNVSVSSSISTTTDESCQTSNNNSDNNTLVVVFQADVQVTLSGPATALAGSSITYVATVQNVSSAMSSSTSDATSVVLTVQLPRNLLTRTFPTGTSYDPLTGIATLSVGQVNRGVAALSYNFTFTLPGNTQSVAGIASAAGFQPDPNTANNDGSTAAMQVATAVALPAGTGTCTGTTFDNTTAAGQGLYAEYYKGYFADVLTYFNSPKVPDVTRSETSPNFPASNAWGDLTGAFSSGSVSDPDQYSARYRGYLTIATAGSYTFTLQSDDAAYLWLDNAARATTPTAAFAVVSDPGAHAARTTVGAAVTLTAGAHPLLAFYGEQAGGNSLQILYSGPDTGGATVLIPQSALCNRQFSGPLPVTLAEFTAQAAGRAARLSWRTASEQHNDHFEVERSRDGLSYVRIGTVAGAGTSTAAHDYAFADGEAAQPGGSTVYYRLRQVDTDGTATYSPTRTVGFGAAIANSVGFSLAPNPAGQRVRLYLQTVAAGQVRVLDLAGRVVLAQALAADANVPALDLSSLPAGLYVVQVEQNGQRFTQRLVHAVD